MTREESLQNNLLYLCLNITMPSIAILTYRLSTLNLNKINTPI